jgi:hypothetical protein
LVSGIVAFHEGRHERAEALLGRLIVVQSPAATAILYEYLADLWGRRLRRPTGRARGGDGGAGGR